MVFMQRKDGRWAGFFLEDKGDCIQIDDETHFELLDKLNSGFDILLDENWTPTYVKKEIPTPNSIKILILKQKLLDTDYLVIKFAEGLLSEDEYAPTRVQRQAWRDEINRLEAEMEAEQ